jgi:hypothetical protein
MLPELFAIVASFNERDSQERLVVRTKEPVILIQIRIFAEINIYYDTTARRPII